MPSKCLVLVEDVGMPFGVFTESCVINPCQASRSNQKEYKSQPIEVSSKCISI